MSYNKFYGRHSNRYNTSGKFVPASDSEIRRNSGNMGHMPPMDNVQFNNSVTKGQLKTEQQQPPQQQQQSPMQVQEPPHSDSQQQPEQQSPEEPPKKKQHQLPQQSDVDTKQEIAEGDPPARPFWMKSKLQGVKKINNRERRRRQNETLRRLLAPKNALMVLNEMLPGDTLALQFKVEPLAAGSPARAPHAYCAQLALDAQTYTGYGETKIVARNAAAEQAIRDLMIQRMERVLKDRDSHDGTYCSRNGHGAAEDVGLGGDRGGGRGAGGRGGGGCGRSGDGGAAHDPAGVVRAVQAVRGVGVRWTPRASTQKQHSRRGGERPRRRGTRAQDSQPAVPRGLYAPVLAADVHAAAAGVPRVAGGGRAARDGVRDGARRRRTHIRGEGEQQEGGPARCGARSLRGALRGALRAAVTRRHTRRSRRQINVRRPSVTISRCILYSLVSFKKYYCTEILFHCKERSQRLCRCVVLV